MYFPQLAFDSDYLSTCVSVECVLSLHGIELYFDESIV